MYEQRREQLQNRKRFWRINDQIFFFFFLSFYPVQPKVPSSSGDTTLEVSTHVSPFANRKKNGTFESFPFGFGFARTNSHVKAKKRIFFFTILPSLFFSSPSLSPTMLDFFWIFTKGGIILWSFQSFPIRGNPVNDLIQNILLEVSLSFSFSPFRPFHPRLLSFDLVEIGAFRHHIVYCGPVPHEVDLCQ